MTDGAGSPRSGVYADYTDEEMKEVRIAEQKKAAAVGKYSFQMLLGHPSKEVKDPKNTAINIDDHTFSFASIAAPTNPASLPRLAAFIFTGAYVP